MQQTRTGHARGRSGSMRRQASALEDDSGSTQTLQKTVIYAILLLWAFVCLFPIYWTVTTAFKEAKDICKRAIIPWLQFRAELEGLGVAWTLPGHDHRVLERATQLFLKHGANTVIDLTECGHAGHRHRLASRIRIGPVSYRFGPWRNNDISFWFLSQLILPPVAIALPVLVLYRELDLLDTRTGLILVYTIMNLPIVIWIMRDQFNSIPVELEQAALVDGARSGRRFCASWCRSLVLGSWPRSFFPSFSPGTSTSSPLCFPAPTRRRCRSC